MIATKHEGAGQGICPADDSDQRVDGVLGTPVREDQNPIVIKGVIVDNDFAQDFEKYKNDHTEFFPEDQPIEKQHAYFKSIKKLQQEWEFVKVENYHKLDALVEAKLNPPVVCNGEEDIDASFKPEKVFLDEGVQLREYCDRVWDALLITNKYKHPTIFQKSGNLVRVVKLGSGSRVIQQLNYDTLYNAITYRIDFVRRFSLKEIESFVIGYVGNSPDPRTIAKSKVINLKPRQEIIKNILYRPSFEGLPELIGVVTCPIIDLTTSEIRTDSHYDPVSQMYYGNNGTTTFDVPKNPTQIQVDDAINLLKETIIDFPFVSESNRTNCLALLITSVIRPSINGNIPIFLIDKPAAGTGAGLLCDTISLISTGEIADVKTMSKGEDEWKKVIISILKQGNLLSIIDNIESKLDLPSLASVVTSGKFSDRILGGNQISSFPHKQIWIVNGNNVQIGGDLPRRIVWIRMNANLERPWLRDAKVFTHSNQITWIAENRGRILCAIYTIIRSWINTGSVKADNTVTQMGSFENWRDVIGGVMQFMQCKDFLNNSDDLLSETDVDAPQWNNFISLLFERVADWDSETNTMVGSAFSKLKDTKEVRFTTQNIIDIIEFEKNPVNVTKKIRLSDALPEDLADDYGSQKNFNRVFGIAMRKHVDRIFDNNYKLEREEKKNRLNKLIWKITKI